MGAVQNEFLSDEPHPVSGGHRRKMMAGIVAAMIELVAGGSCSSDANQYLSKACCVLMTFTFLEIVKEAALHLCTLGGCIGHETLPRITRSVKHLHMPSLPCSIKSRGILSPTLFLTKFSRLCWRGAFGVTDVPNITGQTFTYRENGTISSPESCCRVRGGISHEHYFTERP